MTTPAFPVNAQKARVWFYWWGQDGGGSGRKTTFRPTATDLTDMAAFGYIETETKVVTPDPTTALVYADLICTDDEDLTPFLWEVTREGQTPKMIAVSVNAPEMDVGGVTMRAVPLTDAATPDPPPEPVTTYYDSQQTDAVVTNGINAHDTNPQAHQDIRDLISEGGTATGAAGGVLSGTYPNPGFAQDMATQAELDGKQPADPDLTAIAALDSTTAGMLATDGAGWLRKTYAQVKTALGIGISDVTSLQTTLDEKVPAGHIDPMSYRAGAVRVAVCDGTSHPLSEVFGSLAAAQAIFPDVTTLTQERDWAAFQQALTDLPAEGGTLRVAGHFYFGADTISTTRRSIQLLGQGGQNYFASSTTSSITCTSATNPVFDIGRSDATEHRGWVVQNLSVINGNPPSGAPGAFRLRRVNYSRFLNVNVDGFQDGYGWQFDGTGDTCQYTELTSCRGRNLKKAVTYVAKADDTVILGGSFFGTNQEGSVGFELGSSMRAFGSNVQGFQTHVSLDGNNPAISNSRHDSSAGVPVTCIDVLPTAVDAKVIAPSFGGTYPAEGHIRVNTGANRTCIIFPSTGGGTAATQIDNGTDTTILSWGEGLRLRGDANVVRGDGGVVQAAGGFATRIKAGALTDADYSAAPPDGSTGINTSTGGWQYRSGGSWREIAPSSTPAQAETAQAVVANTATETTAATYTVAANATATGTTLRLRAGGTVDNIATSGSLTVRVRLGGVTIGQFIISSGAAARTGANWWLDETLTFRAMGVAGTVAAAGMLVGVLGTGSMQSIPNTQTPGSTINTTVSQDLTLTSQWATADAGNVFRVEVLTVETVKP